MAVDYNRIGKRIAELRKSRGMTQASLAEKAEITNNFLSHIERSLSLIHILFESPELLEKAKAEHAARVGDGYVCPIPAGVKPRPMGAKK